MEVESFKIEKIGTLIHFTGGFFAKKNTVEDYTCIKFSMDLSSAVKSDLKIFSNRIGKMDYTKLKIGKTDYIEYKPPEDPNIQGRVIFKKNDFYIVLQNSLGPEILREPLSELYDYQYPDEMNYGKEESDDEESDDEENIIDIENIEIKTKDKIKKFKIYLPNGKSKKFSMDFSRITKSDYIDFIIAIDDSEIYTLKLGNDNYIKYNGEKNIVTFKENDFIITIKCEVGPEILREALMDMF